MDNIELIRGRLEQIEQRISSACARCGRKAGDVRLVAVCKKQPVEALQVFLAEYSSTGRLPILAENYVQDYRSHKGLLRGDYISHLIGPLQSNKVRDAVAYFDVIQSVHNERIARLVDSEAGKLGKKQKIFLQVNISHDEAKSGFQEAELQDFVTSVLPALKFTEFCGLMTITRFYDQPEMARPDFRAMRLLAERLGGRHMELSMGMSDDYETAIEEGATMVRIGSALFGSRLSRPTAA